MGFCVLVSPSLLYDWPTPTTVSVLPNCSLSSLGPNKYMPVTKMSTTASFLPQLHCTADSDTLELVFKQKVVLRFAVKGCAYLGEYCLWEGNLSLPCFHFHIHFRKYFLLYITAEQVNMYLLLCASPLSCSVMIRRLYHIITWPLAGTTEFAFLST